jgi:copper oxidase (laccase) domain-containing protein
VAGGIPAKNIRRDTRCTIEEASLYSHRRGNVERNLAVIALEPR